MYRKRSPHVTSLNVNNSMEGSPLHIVLERAIKNGENLGAEVAIIYTPRKDGVQPAYNIRTDRFEVALDGIDKVNKSYQARRDAKLEVVKDNNGEAEPIQGTND